MVDLTSFTPNPQRPDNWLGWSKAAQEPGYDKSGEIIGKTIGKAVEQTGEIAGQYVKEKTADESEALISQQTEELQNVQESLLGPRAQADDANVPDAVQRAPAVKELLDSARANGSISPTYHLGQRDAYLKDMRSQYGGMFRKQIDAGFAEGENRTANQLYQNTLRDVNSFLTKKDEGVNKLISKALETPGSVEAAAVAKGLINKTMNTDEAIDRLQKVHAFDFAVQENNKYLANKKAGREDTSEEAFSGLTVELHNQAASIASNAAAELGLTPTQIDDFTKHPEKLKATDMQVFAQKFDAYRNTVRQKFTDIAQQQRYAYDEKTKTKIPVDPYAAQTKDWQKAVDTAMQTFDHTSTLIKDAEVGPLHYWSNMDKAVRSDFNTSMLMDKNGLIGPLMLSKWFKDNGMDKVGQEIIQDVIKDKFPDKVTGLVNSLRGRAMMTPAQAGVYGGKPSESLSDDLNFLYNHGMNNSDLKGTFIRDLHHITEPDFPPQQKAALILHTFGPKNVGNLSAWQRNGLQPDGTVSNAPDRWNMLGAMTDPKITQEVWKLNSDPRYASARLWDNYKSTTNEMVKVEFDKQARDLNAFQAEVKYDSDKHEFSRIVPQGAMPKSGIREGNHPVDRLLAKLNIGLHSMADIAKQEGSHPDAYIYNMMKDLGFDIDKTKTTGGMMQSLINTHAAQQKKYEDELNKMVEEVKGLGKKKPQ